MVCLWQLKKLESVPVDLSALEIGTDKLKKWPAICVAGLKHPWHCYTHGIATENIFAWNTYNFWKGLDHGER